MPRIFDRFLLFLWLLLPRFDWQDARREWWNSAGELAPWCGVKLWANRLGLCPHKFKPTERGRLCVRCERYEYDPAKGGA